MHKVIRQGIFETNSSSTHNVCVAKHGAYTIPATLVFLTGEFGWEVDTLRSLEDKASYLYTALLCCDRDAQVAEMVEHLSVLGVASRLIKPRSVGDGYVEHGGNLGDFLDAMQQPDVLCRYLFSDLSYVLTGHDNASDYQRNDPPSDIHKTHTTYYKGN